MILSLLLVATHCRPPGILVTPEPDPAVLIGLGLALMLFAVHRRKKPPTA